MTSISWTKGPNSALDDLRELSLQTADALLDIGVHVLRSPVEPDDLDEGSDFRQNSPLMWRRGLSREQRRELDQLEAAGMDRDYDDPPWDYVLIYRERTLKEVITQAGRGLVVLRVVRNEVLADQLLRNWHPD